MVISTTRPAPVASVLPSRASATFPPDSRSPMTPEPMTMASSSAVPSASAVSRRGRSNASRGGSRLASAASVLARGLIGRLPDLPQVVLELALLQLLDRQLDEEADAVAQLARRLREGQGDFGLAACRLRGIGDAPVRCHRLAVPDRTDFAGGVVTDGEDEIERRRIGAVELVPGFRTEAA